MEHCDSREVALGKLAAIDNIFHAVTKFKLISVWIFLLFTKNSFVFRNSIFLEIHFIPQKTRIKATLFHI